ncbi:MAG: ABC transporter permease [Muribaculaceae bacterium]|nr:ABC transporter permease [Muribaculaceae bacterium]
MSTGFIDGMKREIRRMTGRKMYIFGMLAVPLFMAFFFLDLLSPGLPNQVPTAVVDLDHSSMSRTVTRSLSALQVLDLNERCESYDEALEMVRKGKIFGFFVIPSDFEKNALAGNVPTLEYYSNMTYFVPGTLAFKGFKTVAVATSGGVVQQTLVSLGATPEQISSLVQPLDLQINALNNPWMSYAIYLCPSFTMATFVLMIMLMTVFSITMEVKTGSSVEWLGTAKGNIWIATASKLLPQTVIWVAVGIFIQWLFFGLSHFPLNGSIGWMLLATVLVVIASQGVGLFVSSVVPNPRLAFSLTALFGILSFSFTGFSFPVESMYGWLGIFSYLAPIRYWFLIYINEALNGVGIYYSRYFFVALIVLPLVACSLLPRLRRACLKPVYVP